MSEVTAAWLITGVPGAGKSTVARGLARRLPLSAHVEGDVLQELVVVTQARLDLYRQLLGDLDLHLVVLDPRPEVVLGRDRAREKHVAHLFLYLREEMVRELSDVGLWIDSGKLSTEETVDAVLAGRDAARLPPSLGPRGAAHRYGVCTEIRAQDSDGLHRRRGLCFWCPSQETRR